LSVQHHTTHSKLDRLIWTREGAPTSRLQGQAPRFAVTSRPTPAPAGKGQGSDNLVTTFDERAFPQAIQCSTVPVGEDYVLFWTRK
jgi:hypothetical protein